jgi:hypothetical protein
MWADVPRRIRAWDSTTVIANTYVDVHEVFVEMEISLLC